MEQFPSESNSFLFFLLSSTFQAVLKHVILANWNCVGYCLRYICVYLADMCIVYTVCLRLWLSAKNNIRHYIFSTFIYIKQSELLSSMYATETSRCRVTAKIEEVAEPSYSFVRSVLFSSQVVKRYDWPHSNRAEVNALLSCRLLFCFLSFFNFSYVFSPAFALGTN